ncbi:MAG: tetratricopeptide repeat protein [Thermomicrobiales bacterium]
MDEMPKLAEKYKILFIIMAGIMVLSLGLGIVGPLVFDAIDSASDGGGNSTEISASVAESFRSTAEANPDDPSALAAYANYLANTGELASAIPWYEKAIALAPDDAVLRIDFARSLAAGDMHGDAELQFQKAIELAPENPEAHYYLAELYYGLNPQRLVDAIDEYERTIELAPEAFIAQRAEERLVELGVATPEASPSPAS